MNSILAFFVLICVLVFVHEYGHFWAARKCGVKVLRFSIGFGKVLWRRKDKHGTEFAFSLIPLGGYVQMFNGEPEQNLPADQALKNKSVLQRAFIVVAGPAANFIFAVLAYWLVFIAGVPTIKPVVGEVLPQSIAAQANITPEFEITHVDGRQVLDWEDVALSLVGRVGSDNVEISGKQMDTDFPLSFSLDLRQWNIESNKQSPLTSLGIRPKSSVIEPIIHAVVENSPAEKAGIRQGDIIRQINGNPFDWHFLIEQVQRGETLDLLIEQEGHQKNIMVTPEKREKRYIIGIQPTYQPLADKYRTVLEYDMLTALEKSLYKTVSLVKTILQFIANLLSGDLALNNMGGPISMAKGAAATAEIGWVYYFGFMALISVNLGVMNLFPILPLDGGQLLLLGAESLRKKPLSEKVQLRFQQLGIFFVLGLMTFALLNDLIHF